MTLRSDWMVRAFSLFLFLFGVVIMVGNALVGDQGQWLVLGMLVGILCAGWKWPLAICFDEPLRAGTGSAGRACANAGRSAGATWWRWQRRHGWWAFKPRIFNRVVLTFYKNDRKREMMIASYWSTHNPEQDAAAFIAQAPEPHHDKLRSRLIDQEYGGLPTTQRAREWRAQARAIRRRSDAD